MDCSWETRRLPKNDKAERDEAAKLKQEQMQLLEEHALFRQSNAGGRDMRWTLVTSGPAIAAPEPVGRQDKSGHGDIQFLVRFKSLGGICR